MRVKVRKKVVYLLDNIIHKLRTLTKSKNIMRRFMSSFSVRVVSNITKEYPDMIKVIIYKEPKTFVTSGSRFKRNKREVDSVSYTPSVSSLNRTKTLVRDIVLSNDFELFCTFTFDPDKVDSFKLYKCWSVMSTWLHHQRDRSRECGREFKYLIIPEQHKSGRWHFHALISGYTSTLKASKNVTKTLRPIYNITSFRRGFTTAVEIDSKEGVSSYITKYITKDFIKTFNQRRFFCSRNLTRPVRTVNSSLFSDTLPLFRRKVVDSGNIEEYEIPLPTRPEKKPRQNYFDLVREQKLQEMVSLQNRELYF